MPSSTAKVVGHRPYTAKNGDSFDLLALQAYGEERMAYIIAKANPDHVGVLIFEGGEQLSIPIVETVQTPESLPPWRR